MKIYRVAVGAEADSLEAVYRIKAKTAKAAEFDAKHQAAQDYPFVDPSDLVILSIREER